LNIGFESHQTIVWFFGFGNKKIMSISDSAFK